MTRQREWQRKMVGEGRCPQCGKDAGGRYRCEGCRRKDAERAMVRKNGHKSEVFKSE